MRTPRRLTALTIALAGSLLGTSGAHAEFTTGGCLAQKSKVWGNLRKCQRTEGAKQLLGATADLAKCQTKFQIKLTTIDEKASTAGVPCRYGDNGDNTVTDYDTGLMWVKLTGLDGVPQPYILDADDYWDWKTAIEVASALSGPSYEGTAIQPVPGNGLHVDWRLPNIIELESIADENAPGCGSGSPCIDPIFGPTAVTDYYWSSTTILPDTGEAWCVEFYGGGVVGVGKTFSGHVRAVRSGL